MDKPLNEDFRDQSQCPTYDFIRYADFRLLLAQYKRSVYEQIYLQSRLEQSVSNGEN